ncbi:molybdopterin cofactor-binding domain-containing protein [uncultured Roseobacter sp.]|uniref:xanthine dehydrogenase family protein molybdopterin-binding subunit n=1 Tax=uncultured Roseobacter sp. TaxID=114847 RepID=UPI002613989F|nr:molybdopterin cofactor-binding domain-containing protein [uncultured Roseobacter sp.]
MARNANMKRRTVLIGSLAVAGGVAFGAWRLARPHDNPLTATLAPGEASFNPFVLVTPGGITLITPHADVGQGAQSMQAMLIAEEMDIGFGQFETSFGQPDAAYYNRAVAGDAVPFVSTDTGLLAGAVRDAAGVVSKVMGLQITGGSTSVPDSFEKLRHAGAVARETLKAAAAAKSGIPADGLRTQDAAVILPDGARLTYTSLAAEAAQISPVSPGSLRPPSEWRLAGQQVQRLDIAAKSTGRQSYGIDARPDGVLFASARLNPGKGGGLKGYDASRAEGMQGVRQILPLQNGVAVIADNTWYAFQALKEIDCDWGGAPYPAEQKDHWRLLGFALDGDTPDRIWRDDRDPDQTVADGFTAELEFRAPYVAHQPLEPLNATVLITGDHAEVWAAHQMPGLVQARVAGAAGLDPSQVVFHNQMAGGSFGHRLEFDVIDYATEIALQIPGRPVRLVLSREEDFAQDYPRQIGMARGAGGWRAGQVTHLALNIASPSVTRSQAGRAGLPAPGPDTQIVAGAWNMPYAIPTLSVTGFAVEGLAPVSSWRSVGASTAGFFAECLLDEVIHAAGADPMEERLRLVSDPVARAVLEAVADMSDWGAPQKPGQGRGVALVTSFGVPVAQVTDVTRTPGGLRIDRVWVAADAGTVIDPLNFEAQVQGGVIWGLGHAINSEITYADGAPQQSNYHEAEGMRLYQTPQITVRTLQNASQIRGIGEPPVPPAAPALANAVFAATGQRLREMPFNRHVAFV